MPASPMVGELATHRQSDIPQAMRIAILAMIIPMLLGGPLPASAAGKLDVDIRDETGKVVQLSISS